MPSASTANLLELQKVLYPEGAPEFLQLTKSRLFMQATHKTDFTGSQWELAITTGDSDGGSSNFATALANRKPGQHIKFAITRKSEYVIGSLENEALKAIKGDKGAITDLMRNEMDLKGTTMGERIRRRFLGNAGGSLGVIESISTTDIVLTAKGDMRNFRVGRVVMAASDDGTGVTPTGDRTGTITVTKVDVANRTVRFSADVTTAIPGITAGDYLFPPGDYGTAPIGVFGWIPFTAPTGSLAGVDRSLYPELTAGFRHEAGGGSMVEALNDAIAVSAEYSTATELYGYLNFSDMAKLNNELEGRAITREVSGRGKFAQVSWKTVVVNAPDGEVSCSGDAGIPEGYCLIGDPKDIVVRSLGELPHFSEEKLQQESSADAQQFRLRAWWNVGVKKPWNFTLLKWR